MTHVPAPRQTTGGLAMGYPMLLAEKIETDLCHEGYRHVVLQDRNFTDTEIFWQNVRRR